MAGNYYGGPYIKKLVIEAANESEIFSFDTRTKPSNNMGWETNTWNFQAIDSVTTISFRSLENYSSYGPTLDNVAVNSVPIPGAIWLLSAGLISIASIKLKFSK